MCVCFISSDAASSERPSIEAEHRTLSAMTRLLPYTWQVFFENLCEGMAGLFCKFVEDLLLLVADEVQVSGLGPLLQLERQPELLEACFAFAAQRFSANWDENAAINGLYLSRSSLLDYFTKRASSGTPGRRRRRRSKPQRK